MSATKATPIVLGGETRTLRYTNRALVALEDETGKTFAQLSVALAAGSLRAVSALIWAGLLHEAPRLTVDEVVDRLDLKDEPALAALGEAIGTALEVALGPEKKGEPEPANPPTTG